jgi:hypothetical protein
VQTNDPEKYLVPNMSCLLSFILLMAQAAEVTKDAPSASILDHPISQAILALGGIGVIAYIGATRGPRIRLPLQTLDSEAQDIDKQDAHDTP